MKKLLTAVAILSALVIPALAWNPTRIFRVINHTDPVLIQKITFKSPGFLPQSFTVNDPGGQARFFGPSIEDGGPCFRYVVIDFYIPGFGESRYRVPQQFDVCESGTITVSGLASPAELGLPPSPGMGSGWVVVFTKGI